VAIAATELVWSSFTVLTELLNDSSDPCRTDPKLVRYLFSLFASRKGSEDHHSPESWISAHKDLRVTTGVHFAADLYTPKYCHIPNSGAPVTGAFLHTYVARKSFFLVGWWDANA